MFNYGLRKIKSLKSKSILQESDIQSPSSTRKLSYISYKVFMINNTVNVLCSFVTNNNFW